ncbi:hypothetical protein OR61_22465, partial [Xanthomonas vesicatoria]
MSLTSQQYAALSHDVYDEPEQTGPRSPIVDIGGVSYQRLKYVDSPSGYQGIVYQRVDTQEIIVAHRGTETERQLKEDGLYTDGGMATARYNNQGAEALELTRYALNYAHELGNGGKTPEVTVTGHSLGGDLAQVTAHHYGLKGETFNAYGTVSLDRRIPEGGSDVINHVMAGDAVSAASKHYGKVRIYAAPQEITALQNAGYANDDSSLDGRNPAVAKQLGDSHRMHNFLPVDGNDKPDRSVLEDPKSQQLAQQYAQMIDKYGDDVALLRGGLTMASRGLQSMNVTDGINHLRGPSAPRYRRGGDGGRALEGNAAAHGARRHAGLCAPWLEAAAGHYSRALRRSWPRRSSRNSATRCTGRCRITCSVPRATSPPGPIGNRR